MKEKLLTLAGGCLVMAAFIALPFLPIMGSETIQASTEASGSTWVCPIDARLPKDLCENVMASDPGYMTEEDSKAQFEPEDAGILAANSCTYSGVTHSVTCEGDNNANTFYIGKDPSNNLAICIQNVNWWAYSPANVYYFTIWGYGGADWIEVRTNQITCRNSGGATITLSPFDSGWTSYLVGRGGDGDDTIFGTQNNDFLYGEGGADYLSGMNGSDYLYGGSNPAGTYDTIYCGNGSDHAYGETGSDRLYCYEGNQIDYLYGGSESDTYFAPPGGSYMQDLAVGASYADGNIFQGNSGSDEIHGDNGTDTIYGYNGVDLIYGLGGGDIIYGGRGNDIIHGGDGGDWIWGEGEDDTIYGEGGLDCLVGDYNATGLTGYEGADTIDPGPDHENCVYCDTVQQPYHVCEPDNSFDVGDNGDTAIGCTGTNSCPGNPGCSTDPPSYCETIF